MLITHIHKKNSFKFQLQNSAKTLKCFHFFNQQKSFSLKMGFLQTHPLLTYIFCDFVLKKPKTENNKSHKKLTESYKIYKTGTSALIWLKILSLFLQFISAQNYTKKFVVLTIPAIELDGIEYHCHLKVQCSLIYHI